jgi:ubiquinone/menaquinone biosynthesis C-methylase UbiE
MHSFNFLIAFDYLKRLRIITNLIGNPIGKSIVDVGCGDGIHAATLASYGAYVVGVDISQKRLKRCKRRVKGYDFAGLMDFVVADAEHLPLRPSLFDYAICSEVIEHLRRPQVAGSELANVIRKEGRVILTTPNTLSVFELVSHLRKRFRLPAFTGPRSEPPFHLSFTSTGLRYLLENSGLKTIRISTASLGWRVVFEGSRKDTKQTLR